MLSTSALEYTAFQPTLKDTQKTGVDLSEKQFSTRLQEKVFQAYGVTVTGVADHSIARELYMILIGNGSTESGLASHRLTQYTARNPSTDTS